MHAIGGAVNSKKMTEGRRCAIIAEKLGVPIATVKAVYSEFTASYANSVMNDREGVAVFGLFSVAVTHSAAGDSLCGKVSPTFRRKCKEVWDAADKGNQSEQ